MKRLGPELKVPDLDGLKVPVFLADVYYDLRDRRLLPLIALIVVAIAAVPFLLGSDPEEPALPPAAAEVGDDEGASAANFAVVEANPGLRAPGKRLHARTPTNPFKQRYTSLPKEAKLASASSTSVVGGSSSEASVTDPAGSVAVGATEGSTSPGGSPGSARPPGADAPPGTRDRSGPGDGSSRRFFAFRPDVRFGVAGSGELNERKDVPLGTLMPRRKPVIVFIGGPEDGQRVTFDVSHEVAMVKGPGRCIGGPQSCSLLMLREGEWADIVTAVPGRSFRLKVISIDFVEVDRPKPAGSSSVAGGAADGWGLVQSFSK